MDKLIAGIEWLASNGRNGAKELAAHADDDGQFVADLEEAFEWLKDIVEGNEI